MKNIRHTYGDPTGGGEDVTVVAPEWVHAPSTLTFRTGKDGDRVTFDLEDSEEGEA